MMISGVSAMHSVLLATFAAVHLNATQPSLFDAPAYDHGNVLPSAPEGTNIYAMASASSGSVWIIAGDVNAAGNERLVQWLGGQVVSSSPLTPGCVSDLQSRLVERGDGRLTFVQRSGVQVLAQDGSKVAAWSIGGASGAWVDADADSNGTVYALLTDHLDVYDAGGNHLRTWAAPQGETLLSVSIGSGGRAYIYAAHEEIDWVYSVHVVSAAGDLIRTWTVDHYLENQQRICVMRSGTVYFLPAGDTSTINRIDAYSGDGVYLTSWAWFDPAIDALDGCRPAPGVVVEDQTSRLLMAANGACDVPAMIDTYAALGPGLMIQPDADDVPYSVDDETYTGQHRFVWAAGGGHSISVSSSTTVVPGTRRDFVAWGDGGAPAHSILAAPSATGFRLRLQTMHLVQTVVDSGGTATSSPGWVNEGQEITLSAQEALGHRFVKWGNPDSAGWHASDVLTPEWTHIVTHPESWEACFVRRGLLLSISGSATDPDVNTAAPAMGPRQLYLWAKCLDHGISAFEGDVTGSLTPMGFNSANGVFNIGDAGHLLCGIPGCPIGAEVNHLLGSWWVVDNGGDFCLGRSAAHNLLTVVDCPSPFPRTWTPTIVGFSSVGSPCVTGPLCGSEPDSLVPDPTDAPEVAAPASSSLALVARGNPFHGSIEFTLDLPTDGRVDLRVFDVTGRLVRTLVSGGLSAGHRAMTWDGRDDGGAVTPSGVYFARVEIAGERRTTKIVRVSR